MSHTVRAPFAGLAMSTHVTPSSIQFDSYPESCMSQLVLQCCSDDLKLSSILVKKP